MTIAIVYEQFGRFPLSDRFKRCVIRMCFPNTLSQLDFKDSQLCESEIQEAIEKYQEKWVDEIGQFQLSEIYSTSGESRKCSLIKCLPKPLQDKFYLKYHHLIGKPGKGPRMY